MNTITKENIDKIAAYSLQAHMTMEDLIKFISNTRTKLVNVTIKQIREYRTIIRTSTASKALGY